MDRTPWLTAQGITSYDLNNMPKDALKGLAWLTQFLLGSTSSFAANGSFAPSQTSPASLSINIGAGWIYQLADTEANPIGSFAADDTQIMQQGYAAAQEINLNNSGLSGGQSKWWLIQVAFQEVDAVRPGDPTSGRRGFYNSSNPAGPLDGIDGLGGVIPTIKAGAAVVTAIAGTPGSTGSNVPPQPSSGCVPLFLINVSSGQTQITNAEIQVAGPSVYAGYPSAPFLAGLVNQHHHGTTGQAPQIDLTTEVQNVLPLPHLPVTNSAPPVAGGSITMGGIIPVSLQGTVNPNSNVAGNKGDEFFQTSTGYLFKCTTTGTASTAVWGQVLVSTPPPAEVGVLVTSSPHVPQPNYIYQYDTASGASVVNMQAASGMGGGPVSLVNIGNTDLTVNPYTGESLAGAGANVSIVLHPGDGIKLSPRASVGYYRAP